LFPGHQLLTETDKLIASIEDSPKPPPRRITFTLKLVNAAKDALFVVTGDGKKQVLHEAFEVKPNKYPVEFVKARQETLWFLDTPAASLLSTASLNKV
jgi:6-phosphogluconolactonase